MDARTGKRIRLGRLFDQISGNAIIVAYSHGVLLGPIEGLAALAQMQQTVQWLADAEGIMIAPGLVSRLEDGFIGRRRPSLVIHLDWTNFSRKTLPYEQGAQRSLATIDEVAAAGADAVMTYLLLGNDDPEREAEEIARNAAVARACERWGIVHMIEPRHSRERRDPETKQDPEIMQLYCRIAAEIGADLVKCIWPGSVAHMQAITESCLVPVLVAGGARTAHPDGATNLARDAIAGGAKGLVFGRNIYQADNPAATLAALRAIVHGRSER